jgi:hypothetical protein
MENHFIGSILETEEELSIGRGNSELHGSFSASTQFSPSDANYNVLRAETMSAPPGYINAELGVYDFLGSLGQSDGNFPEKSADWMGVSSSSAAESEHYDDESFRGRRSTTYIGARLADSSSSSLDSKVQSFSVSSITDGFGALSMAPEKSGKMKEREKEGEREDAAMYSRNMPQQADPHDLASYYYNYLQQHQGMAGHNRFDSRALSTTSAGGSQRMPVLNEDSEHRASLPLTAQEYRQSAHQSMQNQNNVNMYGNRNGGGSGNGNANANNNPYDFRHLSPEQQQAVAAEVHHKQMLAMNMAMNMNMNMNMNMQNMNLQNMNFQNMQRDGASLPGNGKGGYTPMDRRSVGGHHHPGGDGNFATSSFSSSSSSSSLRGSRGAFSNSMDNLNAAGSHQPGGGNHTYNRRHRPGSYGGRSQHHGNNSSSGHSVGGNHHHGGNHHPANANYSGAGRNARGSHDAVVARERAGRPSSLVEEVLMRGNGTSSGSAKAAELLDIKGHVTEFCCDQNGSRFIQQKLEHANAAEKEAVFAEILPGVVELTNDVFGNYVIQKFFEHGTKEQVLKLTEMLKGSVLTLSLQMYGCRVVQKALECLEETHRVTLAHELDGSVLQCVKDQNGNHVIQKCVELVPPRDISFVVDAFGEVAVFYASHPYGCRVIQRILEFCLDEHRNVILEELLPATVSLVYDQYGNYVIQHILQHGSDVHRKAVISKLQGNFTKLSVHKFASNVVEKCLVFGDADDRHVIVAEVVPDEGCLPEANPLVGLMRDQFGNYVVQKMLDVSQGNIKSRLVASIHETLPLLKGVTHAKHIVARLERHQAVGGVGVTKR